MQSSAIPRIRPSLEMRLENFRLFEDTGLFRLAPLTFLVGRNSSGKSSVISALLLLKQSIEQDSMGSGTTPLTLAGPYCDLGTYSDLVRNHDETSELSFSFGVTFADVKTRGAESADPFVGIAVPRPPLSRGYFFRSLNMELPARGRIDARLTFATDEPFGPSLSRVELTVTGIGAANFVRTTSGQRRQHWRVYTTDLPAKTLRLRNLQRSFFPMIDIRDSHYSRCAPWSKHRIKVFVAAWQELSRYLGRSLSRTEFIGPFRTPPERRYAFAGFNTLRAGSSGEQAVDLLITESLLKGERTSKSLHAATSFWIKHLRLAKSLSIKDIAKRLNLFEVGISGASHRTNANLLDVGFGISQVLPVIVQGLLTRPGGIFIVQQPEIHLHPDAQAGLADFFIYLASYGVTTVVETHSEYLLLRMRRRLAEGARPLRTGLQIERPDVKPLSPNDVAVLLTGVRADNSAIVTELAIDKSFQFQNLPAGFMSQALDDRVALLRVLGKRNA